MKILITGPTSKLGEKVIEALLSQDVTVIALYNKTKPKKKILSFKGNLSDKDSLQRLYPKIGKLDAIIHFAAYVPKNQKEDLLIPSLQTNIIGTGNLLDVFGTTTKRIIYVSTTEVYGLENQKEKILETFLPQPLSYYAISKFVGEIYCQAFAQKNNVSLSILRLASMYGYHDGINRALPNFIKACLTQQQPIVYGGDELRDYLHIEDATQAVTLALFSQYDGIFNIGSGNGISIKRTAEIIRDSIDPSITIAIKSRKKKMANLVLNVQKAKRLLQYKPQFIFPAKLEETIDLYKKMG